MDEDTPIYLLNLAAVGRNSAVFAVFSKYTGTTKDGHEVRCASLVSQQKTNAAIYTFDKAVPMINDWPEFYAWLGGRQVEGTRQFGWAGFTIKSAATLVPHWLSEAAEYECQSYGMNSIEFVERSCFAELHSAMPSFHLTGPGADKEALAWYLRITGDLVVGKRPIFAQ